MTLLTLDLLLGLFFLVFAVIFYVIFYAIIRDEWKPGQCQCLLPFVLIHSLIVAFVVMFFFSPIQTQLQEQQEKYQRLQTTVRFLGIKQQACFYTHPGGPWNFCSRARSFCQNCRCFAHINQLYFVVLFL